MLIQKQCKSSLLFLYLYSILSHGFIFDDEIQIGVGVILDMESWVGKSIHSFMSMAMADFYALNNNFRTRIVLHSRDSMGDPLQSLSAAFDLLNNIKVQAILGPETYLEANLLAPFADKAKVPIFSFAGSSSMNYPYMFQIQENESTRAKSIAALVESFKWRNAILIYEDTDHWREILLYLVKSFEIKNTRISHRIAISASATDDQITEELQKLMTVHTTIIIIHMSSPLASRVFVNAKRLGLMGEEYAWIISDKTIDLLQSIDLEVLDSLQGSLGLRSYIPPSNKLRNLTKIWYSECYSKYPTLESKELSVLAIWAYDTIWALAKSIETLGKHNNGVENGPKLLNEVSNTKFKGLSGEFSLIKGKLVSNGFEIINVRGYGERRVGYWTLREGIKKAYIPFRSVEVDAEVVKWPGGSRKTPKGRILIANLDKTLKVGVLTNKKFKYFIDAHHDIDKNVTNATGFSVDVFNTCINALPEKVLYELVPFDTGTYDDLIKKVYNQEIDAVMGDSTILANRSVYVDFTASYTDIGVGTLARISNNIDRWVFVKPLDGYLWLAIGVFVIVTGFVIWAIEATVQVAHRLPAPGIAEIIWFILLTLFFAQGEKLKSNLSRAVVFIWLLVVLILISSYTATLASLLTVEQFELASKGGTLGFHGGSFEAGLAGVTISNVHFEDHKRFAFHSYDSYAEALTKGGKKIGGADAIIDEIPYIKMFLGKYPTDYAMVSSEPTTSGFAFIFQKGSPLVEEFSREIARIREDGTLQLLEKKWFEHQFSLSPKDSFAKPKTLSFHRFSGLFIVSGSSSGFALLLSVIYAFYVRMKVHNVILFLAGWIYIFFINLYID